MSAFPTQFGRYVLLGSLGHGGMAEVFLARDEAMPGAERLAVVKRILSHLARDARFLRMFLDEARINLRMSHPNIAYTFDVGQVGSDYFIAMEYVHGEDLTQLLSRPPTPPPFPLACLIASRVAAALHHAHEMVDSEGAPLQVVHRDVSPQNIRISYEGVVKVLDFGIAKARCNEDSTQGGEIKGKYGYLSPEQAAHREIDRRSDIFSLGIVLHEMLTGSRLFSGPTTTVLRKIEACEVVAPSRATLSTLPETVDQIVLKALAKNPADRYPTARAMQEALDQLLCQHPVTDADLQRLMATVFGGPTTMAHLLEQVRLGTFSPQTEPPSTLQATSATTSEVPGRLRPPRRRLLPATVAVLAAAATAAATLLLCNGPKRPRLEAEPGQARQRSAAGPDAAGAGTPDQTRPTVGLGDASAEDATRPRSAPTTGTSKVGAAPRGVGPREAAATSKKKTTKKSTRTPGKAHDVGDWIIRPKID